MTAPKFTPAGWEVSHAGEGLRGKPFQITEYFVRRPGDDVAIAADIIDPATCQPSLANAHLIAAAPDLYEIVERLAGDLEAEIQHRAPGELPRRIERDMAVVYEARALLAKARGESNG